jgi:hypothetical protein
LEPQQLLDLLQALKDSITAIGTKCDALSTKHDELDARLTKAKTKADEDDQADPTAAQQTAADSAMRSDLAYVKAALRDLQIKQPRPRSDDDRNAFADMQAKADVAFIALGERADAPMQGEELIAYKIRLHRQLQKHSAKWGKVELARIAADSTTFENACDAIRADAVQAGLNPVDLKPFEHRMVTKVLPTGHTERTFAGRGTIYGQLSMPRRYVVGIGGDDRRPRSAGGAMHVQGGQVS